MAALDRNQTCDVEKLVENPVVEASLYCENAADKVAATIENENTLKDKPLGDVDAELSKVINENVTDDDANPVRGSLSGVSQEVNNQKKEGEGLELASTKVLKIETKLKK